jgi:2-polyprenyl-3-methyl-5-hydroxy-6-metoxy-1,4-benzoquinol methylase
VDLRERTDEPSPPGSSSRHPWERSRARFFGRLVAERAAARPADRPVRRLLDVGSGDDWLGRSLLPIVRAHGDPAATVTCWDVHYGPDELARPAPAGVTRTATAPDGSFDLVTALDVLEHVPDGDEFLADQVVASLAPGAEAIISVPAYQSLFGDHDRMLGHFRRYRSRELRNLVSGHLEVLEHGTLFTSLLVPRAVQIGLERMGRHRGESGIGAWSGGPRLTTAIERVLDADAAAGRAMRRMGVTVPGLSIWVVARRPRA